MIARRIASEFAASTRTRGEHYRREGRVRIAVADGTQILATVRGTRAYVVKIAPGDPGAPSMYCSCPFAEDVGFCKHLWATLLEADAKGTLPAPLREPEAARRDGGTAGERGAPEAARTSAKRSGKRNGKRNGKQGAQPRAKAEPVWRKRLAEMRTRLDAPHHGPRPEPWPADRRMVYVVDLTATLFGSGLVIELATERRLKNGSWDRPRQFSLGAQRWMSIPDHRDRQIAQMLVGARQPYGYGYYAPAMSRQYVLPETAYDTTFRLMCETGRCRLRLRPDMECPEPLEWDDGAPWVLHLAVTRAGEGPGYRVDGVFRRGGETMPLGAPSMIAAAGLLFANGRAARFAHGDAYSLAAELRSNGPLAVGTRELPQLLETLYSLPKLPPVDLAPELGITELRAQPVPCLKVSPAPGRAWGTSGLPLSLSFRYEEVELDATRPEPAIYDRDARRVLLRDREAEERAVARLRELGAREEIEHPAGRRYLALPPRRLARAVRELTGEGWLVEAEGRLFRQPGAATSRLRSGVDWFELEGKVEYGDQVASLPRLLAALRRGEHTVVLDDGSLGILPEEWLRRYAPLAGAGVEGDDGALRFGRSQVSLLDAMLADVPEVGTDDAFARARDELRGFERIAPADAPGGFTGTLRPYQREGLGWLHFLRRFGFGGCLADDMGLGKTIQVLALLESRRAAGAGPSLVVVPRSLVFNWKQEAERFAPGLRVLDHTGIQRNRAAPGAGEHDVVITTYGTMRRDIAELREVEFDYVVLDEAQAIKNADTASAKAARLLRGRHRLAMSGTPVENRLEELWSLFHFLNPGMLGAASALSTAAGSTGEEGESARRLLARALRPFILRRTKQQVARDLPEKQEQTLHVELDQWQRKLYDELRDHYRASLLGHVDRVGIRRSKIQILEALLRLRQAACHPGLLDPARVKEPSGKLDALLPMVAEAAAEGHKVLVFSQFTKLLAIVRARLDANQIAYEYLDGRTRDRQARVERFQGDADCPVFLVSLKAGGQGLNLTAADYVFLLDPWWNPAVEAQAIDRAHRIGQSRPVIATRLIARGTVEERVLELQRSKRDLADAIITADNSIISRIEREDLELLLG